MLKKLFKKPVTEAEPQNIQHFDVTVRVHFTELVKDNDPMLHKIAMAIVDGEPLDPFPVNEITFVEYEID